MIARRFIAVFLALFISTIVVHAESWDEPWQKEILQKADYFILAEVIDDNEDWVKLKLIKSFGDKTLPDELLIDDFFMLNLTSSSAHGVHFNFEKREKLYFFLKKNDEGNYSLPTPTSGFANLNAEKSAPIFISQPSQPLTSHLKLITHNLKLIKHRSFPIFRQVLIPDLPKFRLREYP